MVLSKKLPKVTNQPIDSSSMVTVIQTFYVACEGLWKELGQTRIGGYK